MLIRSESIHDVGPGIETVTTALKAPEAQPRSTSPRGGNAIVQSEPVEQHRQLYPSLTLRRLETQGLGPPPERLALLGDRPWIATLLELASEVADAIPLAADEESGVLSTRLLEDINSVELLAAYRRVLISG